MRRDLWLPRARGRERDGWDLGVGRCRLLHLELVRSLVRFLRTTAGLQRDTPLRLGWLLRVPMTWGSLALPHLPWKVLQTESFSGPTFYQGAQGLSVLPPRPPLYTLAPPRQQPGSGGAVRPWRTRTPSTVRTPHCLRCLVKMHFWGLSLLSSPTSRKLHNDRSGWWLGLVRMTVASLSQRHLQLGSRAS